MKRSMGINLLRWILTIPSLCLKVVGTVCLIFVLVLAMLIAPLKEPDPEE